MLKRGTSFAFATGQAVQKAARACFLVAGLHSLVRLPEAVEVCCVRDEMAIISLDASLNSCCTFHVSSVSLQSQDNKYGQSLALLGSSRG